MKMDFHAVTGFPVVQEAIADETIKHLPGRPGRHHGMQPGSYKRKRRMVKLSRRRNRSR